MKKLPRISTSRPKPPPSHPIPSPRPPTHLLPLSSQSLKPQPTHHPNSSFSVFCPTRFPPLPNTDPSHCSAIKVSHPCSSSVVSKPSTHRRVHAPAAPLPYYCFIFVPTPPRSPSFQFPVSPSPIKIQPPTPDWMNARNHLGDGFPTNMNSELPGLWSPAAQLVTTLNNRSEQGNLGPETPLRLVSRTFLPKQILSSLPLFLFPLHIILLMISRFWGHL